MDDYKEQKLAQDGVKLKEHNRKHKENSDELINSSNKFNVIQIITNVKDIKYIAM